MLAFTVRVDASPKVPHLDAKSAEVLARAYDVLFPETELLLGARSFGALRWVEAVLADPRFPAGDAAPLRTARATLDARATKLHHARFAPLSDAQADAVLRTLADEGDPLPELLVVLGLEALLGDPSHGGNPDGRAWAQLGITPPFPRPPAR
jgi:hypothetical protein